ncbi:MAG: tetratricopeptide repeat protein [Rhodocyclaceae bacterium]|nr:tetratricopeptide repeat protein [Rhodocyclaceae bacterium]
MNRAFFALSYSSRRLAGLVACVAATCLTPVYASIEDAQQMIRAGQHAKALELVERHLKNHPKDVQARFLKGVALMGLNRAAEAEAVFKKITEEQPNLPEPYNNLAVIYAQQKQYDKAREALEAAIRTHPAYATAHENLGDIYARLASQAYGKALQLDAANTVAQAKLAMINELIGASAAKAATPPAASTKSAPEKAVPTRPEAGGTTTLAPSSPTGAPKPPQEAKAQETSPPSKPTTPASPAPEEEIAAFVDGWLSAWSRKDVKAYLAHYAADFTPPKGQSRSEWENERKQRLTKPGPIQVRRESLTIKPDNHGSVSVRFRQHYQSANFKASSSKTLLLAKRNGAWQILKETAE